MKKELTCIVCPMGCSLIAEIKDGVFLSVCGNTCKRGAEYAKSECTNPTRIITTTVRCSNDDVLPVKTDAPIPKEKIFDIMKKINQTIIDLPISAGDVIIKNIYGSNVIATLGKGKGTNV